MSETTALTVITAEEEAALHGYLVQAEELARFIRLTSGGKMTLTVAKNEHVAPSVKDRSGIIGLGMEAHDYARTLGSLPVG
jgi:hypothetical protein